MNQKKIKIRTCKKEDLKEIKKIFLEFIEIHKSKDPIFTKIKKAPEMFGDFLTENMQKDSSCVYVAEKNGKIAGYALAYIQERPPLYVKTIYGYVDNIGVAEKFQRQGVGEALFLEIKNWFKSKEIDRLELFVHVQNEKSTSFWKKMGFKTYLEQQYLVIE